MVEEAMTKSLEKGSNISMLAAMTKDLVQELPISFITQNEIVDLITNKLYENLDYIDIDLVELQDSLEILNGPFDKEMKQVLSIILEKVFGIGIDYLYVLNLQFKENPEAVIRQPVLKQQSDSGPLPEKHTEEPQEKEKQVAIRESGKQSHGKIENVSHKSSDPSTFALDDSKMKHHELTSKMHDIPTSVSQEERVISQSVPQQGSEEVLVKVLDLGTDPAHKKDE